MDIHLQNLANTIVNLPEPRSVFFRDDDGGWADKRLSALGHLMIKLSAPLDIAVIPWAVSDETLRVIGELRGLSAELIHLHQHGYQHINHEPLLRKCEFGAARSYTQQFHDISTGWEILRGYFGDIVEPIFTPPWNRCSADTARILSKLGYRGLSCITGSDSVEHGNALRIDVCIDWFKKKNGIRLSWPEFCAYVQKQLIKNRNVGVMLHHEHMDSKELAQLSQFIEMLNNLPQVNFCSMQELCDAAVYA